MEFSIQHFTRGDLRMSRTRVGVLLMGILCALASVVIYFRAFDASATNIEKYNLVMAGRVRTPDSVTLQTLIDSKVAYNRALITVTVLFTCSALMTATALVPRVWSTVEPGIDMIGSATASAGRTIVSFHKHPGAFRNTSLAVVGLAVLFSAFLVVSTTITWWNDLQQYKKERAEYTDCARIVGKDYSYTCGSQPSVPGWGPWR